MFLLQNIFFDSVQVEPMIVIFAESEDTGLLKETYSFTYAISNPYILESDMLGWVVSEEIFNQVRLQKKNFSILI